MAFTVIATDSKSSAISVFSLVQILSKIVQMWYLLHICSNLATLVNPFFRSVISVTEDARGSRYFITMVYKDPSKHQKQFSSTVTPIGVILANRKKQKFIYLLILATCPAHGDGDDTV